MTIKGIDVSVYQSSTYSTSGLGFVFVKATEGTSYANPRHAAQVARARAAGLLVGHYHFARPGSVSAQADYFLQHAAPQPGDLLAYDWEDTGVPGGDKDAWIKQVRASAPGHRVLLYCNLDFWLHRDTTSYCGDGLWIADPDAPAGHPRVEHPWTLHQYSFAGGLDRNVGNFPDPGTLRAWATKTAPSTPPQTPTTTTPKEKTVPTQIVDLPPIGDIGTTDPHTASGRREYGAGYYFAHILDESRKQTALLQQIAAALATKEN